MKIEGLFEVEGDIYCVYHLRVITPYGFGGDQGTLLLVRLERIVLARQTSFVNKK